MLYIMVFVFVFLLWSVFSSGSPRALQILNHVKLFLIGEGGRRGPRIFTTVGLYLFSSLIYCVRLKGLHGVL